MVGPRQQKEASFCPPPSPPEPQLPTRPEQLKPTATMKAKVADDSDNIEELTDFLANMFPEVTASNDLQMPDDLHLISTDMLPQVRLAPHPRAMAATV